MTKLENVYENLFSTPPEALSVQGMKKIRIPEEQMELT